MKLLLDTHVLLCWLDDPAKVADEARVAIANPRNFVYVSAASLQEIVIKQMKKRLKCPEPLLPLLDENQFSSLAITFEHALALRKLSLVHKDPFDRQLLAQCLAEGMTLVTRDRVLIECGVPVLLA